MWCKVRDTIQNMTSDWDWKMILFYLILITIFLVTAYQTYYKYILPRLNPDFIPNKEFHRDEEASPLFPDFPGGGENTGKPAELIFFCVKWCHLCKKALPEWEKLVKKFEGKKINGSLIYFKQIDCEDDEEMADEYKITGYPTIKLVQNTRIVEYNAKPNALLLEEFLNQTLG